MNQECIYLKMINRGNIKNFILKRIIKDFELKLIIIWF